jgi:5-methyltetrahydropteroyltriglutamate--homocysteine methyltransferase
MVITTHVCRGNFRSTWISQGLLPQSREDARACNYDGYFLEYDSERAGGFEPLRSCRRQEDRGGRVITSKSGTLESETVKRRIDEASKFAPLEQLALSPQCGFASTEEGNVLTEEQQWAKMREVVEVAEEIWGK